MLRPRRAPADAFGRVMRLGSIPSRGRARGVAARHGRRTLARFVYLDGVGRVLHADVDRDRSGRGVGSDCRGRAIERLRGAEGGATSGAAIAVQGRGRDGSATELICSTPLTVSRRRAGAEGQVAGAEQPPAGAAVHEPVAEPASVAPSPRSSGGLLFSLDHYALLQTPSMADPHRPVRRGGRGRGRHRFDAPARPVPIERCSRRLSTAGGRLLGSEEDRGALR